MLFAACFIVMAIGMFGIALPFIPGLILMWGAALAYGVFGDFQTVGWVCFVVITLLTITGELAGFLLPGKAAAGAGAPATSIVLGGLAACVGFFAIPVFGFLIGGILGIFLAETVRTGNQSQGWQTTKATLVGFGVGILVQLGFAVAIVASFLVWAIAS